MEGHAPLGGVQIMALKPLKGLATAFGIFPLLLLPICLYGVIGWLYPAGIFDRIAFIMPLPSGVFINLEVGELILLIASLCFVLEVAKSADTGKAGIIDMALSIVLAMVCLMTFALVPSFGTGTFAVLTALQVSDAIGGAVVTATASRRDFAAGA